MPERFKVVFTMQGAIQVLGFTFTFTFTVCEMITNERKIHKYET